jgi:hypothetical protein
MNVPQDKRRFSLRATLLWIAMVSLSFGMLRWAARLDSDFLCYLGLACLALPAVLALIALQRCWRYTIPVSVTLLVTYVGVYLILSANGCYEPGTRGIDGVKWYSWAPVGYVRGDRWNDSMMWTFAPLYFADARLWHPHVRPGYSGPHPINR